METAFWQDLDINTFNIFIRDLSSSVNINLKHMIEDFDKDNNKEIISKSHNKNKKTVIKKKDLIIQQQNEKRYKQFIEEDIKTCKFLLKNINDKNPYLNFEKLKTDEGKLEYKFQLLERYWSKKKKYLSHVFNLYFHIKHSQGDLNEKRTKIMTKIDKILQDYDYKFFMFENLGHLLPPLNFWDKGITKLDPWQSDVIKMIKNYKSIIVRAPTSSGKTFIAMATGIIHNKILYVCPAKPVAYQVGANFTKMGYRVHYLIENHAHLTVSDKTNIYIGIPDTIEKYIYKIGVHFNYAIFDEIHNMNNSYENIIKLLDCNFLALSATIKNSDYLITKFNNLYPSKEIEYVEYNKRFINQQRWVYTDKLKKVHPIICLDTNDFDGFNEISFTPNDCATLYEKLQGEFEDTEYEEKIDSLSPDNYFKDDQLLTLDDTKEYEKILKRELREISTKYPTKLEKLRDSFQVDIGGTEQSKNDFVSLFKKCKEKDLLPMILFHTEENIAKEIFELINTELYESEKLEYPYHYIILEKKKEYYKNLITKREAYASSIKIKTKDPRTEKREKMDEYDKNDKQNYQMSMIDFYNQCISKCKGTENEANKIKNLEKELEEFIKYPEFGEVDIFKKHKNFCFTPSEPMSGSEIRSIKKEIKKTTGKTIEYEDPLFQLLKRGIGLYIQSMPEEYNWIIQKLMSQKKLGIVISDKTLCMGIDLPIRSVCFAGYKNPMFTKEDYLQMSGRAGRRGHDTSGNIIFYNIENYKELMKGELPELTFKDKELNESYNIITKLNPKIKLDKLCVNSTELDIDPRMNKLLWYIKDYEKSHPFVHNIQKYEKKLFMTKERDREYALFSYILEELFNSDDTSTLIQYKQSKIEDNKSKKIILLVGSTCKDIINSLHPMTYKIIVENSRKIFIRIKEMN